MCMEILGSKTVIRILSIVIEEPLREFKEIELIAAAKTGKGSGAAAISALIKEDILLEKRQGRTKLLSLNLKSSTAFALKDLFSQNKMKKISLSKRSAMILFKKEANEYVSLIILFGSTLAGTAKKESDIDLFIVPKDIKQVEVARKKVEELLGEQFNIHYCEKKEIMAKVKVDMFIKNIIIKGYILWGYDFGKEIFSSLSKKENIERLQFLYERVNASLKNYIQKDHETAAEIMNNVIEQLIFYLLEEKNISYASKKDAEKNIHATEEGKQIEKIKRASLKERISCTHDLIIELLQKKLVEEEGYGNR